MLRASKVCLALSVAAATLSYETVHSVVGDYGRALEPRVTNIPDSPTCF